MHVTTNADDCIGAGQCVLIAPEVFDQDDEGTVVLLAESVLAEQEAGVREAANVCPARVINLDDR